MFEFTESIEIKAPAARVWKHLADIKRWWLPSNPEHISLEVRSADKTIQVGTEILFAERVAGIRGEAAGRVTRLIPGTEATWEGVAEYRYSGLRLPIQEGVSWRVEGDAAMAKLSAHVWANFPANAWGRFVEWYAKAFLKVIERDRQHARCELEYLKRVIEATGSRLLC